MSLLQIVAIVFFERSFERYKEVIWNQQKKILNLFLSAFFTFNRFKVGLILITVVIFK